MAVIRLIKKYPNRRLYDTEESRYITLADIRQLVLDKIEFKVIDKQSQDDITRSILLQVISEQEQKGDPILSRDLLSQIIRSYGGTMQGMFSTYLEQSVKLFMTQQQHMRDRIRGVVGTDPVSLVTGIAQRNYNRWRTLQDELMNTLMGTRARPDDDEEDSGIRPGKDGGDQT